MLIHEAYGTVVSAHLSADLLKFSFGRDNCVGCPSKCDIERAFVLVDSLYGSGQWAVSEIQFVFWSGATFVKIKH